MTDSSTERVTEPEARAAYIAMKGRRSSAGVREKFMKEGRKTPSLRTFDKWRARHNWKRLAQENDEYVATGAAAKIERVTVAQIVTRASQFDTLATESLNKALVGLEKVDAKALKVPDIRALYEVAERATKMFELLEGRVTDRTDDMTREKMDALMEEMQKELEESLAGIKTIH